jgi:signal transduction histidine kinase/DNA-binding CsgD family transcriptional regulator
LEPHQNARRWQIGSADWRVKRAEQASARRAEQLAAVSHRLMRVQEEERARIARELHDELGQLLTAAKFELAPLLRTDAVPESIALVQRVLALLDRTVESVRRIAYELRPPLLAKFGLAPALELEVSAFQERTGIECEFSIRSPEIELDPARSTAVFRVVQEALTNVARHAHATRVVIVLHQSPSEVLLDVRDNGRGITPAQLEDPTSLGILGMRERVRQFGGTIDVEGIHGRGTDFIVRIPVPSAAGSTHEPVARGRHERLSEGEFQVFHLLAEGMSVRAIATRLGSSIATVHTRRMRVLRRLGLKSHADLIHYAIACRIV